MSPPFIAGLAGLVSAAATGLVLIYARRRLVDQVNDRSSHRVATPRGGGLGLTIGLLAAWLVATWSTADARVAIAAGALSAIAALGWWDDHANLPARFRLLLQFLGAGAAVAAVGVPAQGSFAGWSTGVVAWLVWPIAVVGTVWLINLTNFMDGIDGIAGGQGLVAGVGAGLLLAGTTADARWAALGWACAGACAGFLIWNRPPARIFMGDVGSTALGLVFGLLVMAQLQAGLALDLALLPLLPFILDATGTLLRRAWRREALSQAHRSHLYQRLARHWGSHLPVTLVYTSLAALGVGGAIAVQRHALGAMLPILCLIGLFAGLSLYGRLRAPA